MLRRLVLLLPLMASSALAAAPQPDTITDGVSHALAQQRSGRVSGLHYALHYSLVPKADITHGHESLQFQLSDARTPLLLDFRDGSIEHMQVNGHAVQVAIEHGHIALEPAWLRAGRNVVETDFSAHVATAQKAITRYIDHDDGAEYLYTLFVPMDASMAFPAFDQPDLKASFQLQLTAPATWTVISNTAAETTQAVDADQKLTVFNPTRPISTYLFAFAAGPFKRVHDVPGLPGLYVRQSKAREAAQVAPQIQQLAANGMHYMSGYFAQPFPFPKYDMVLIPGFAFGGMEHAGATFLREESVLFRSAPTAMDLRKREILVLHELAHQWFGDYTTMRWFDDLWLKEGFAQYIAYQTLASLHPDAQIWRYFYATIKPAAYAIDQTQGTTAIYQDIPNLADAKSAYGSIVYNKAPGVLKQLAYVLGNHGLVFRDGLRLYLARHPYGTAEWSDLIAALEKVSGRRLDDWATAWIRQRGMPQVQAQWSCSDGRLDQLSLSQHDVLGTSARWPIATRVLLGYADGRSREIRADFASASAELPLARGTACPAYVYPNAGDEAYGLFMLDPTSRHFLTSHIGGIRDPFLQAMQWDALWQAVRHAEFAPRDYVELNLQALPRQRDELLLHSLLEQSVIALHSYMGPLTSAALSAQLQQLAAQQIQNAPDQDLRIDWFRLLPEVSDQDAGRTLIHQLLDGRRQVPGVELRQQDRWRLVTALQAYADPQAAATFAAEAQHDSSDFGKEYAYIAKAAVPQAGNKQWYFNDYTRNPGRPEDWISSSLTAFNYWNQSTLTAGYLQPALAELDTIKRHREIFFLLAWLNAFIGGQHSPQAQALVHDYLAHATLAPDLQRKILEIVDPLDRAVHIQQRYPTP
ncbi:M1 family aminopeptidase [Frateuria aurantia]